MILVVAMLMPTRIINISINIASTMNIRIAVGRETVPAPASGRDN